MTFAFGQKEQKEAVIVVQERNVGCSLSLWEYSKGTGPTDDLSIGGWKIHSRYESMQDAVDVAAQLVWLGLDGTRYVTKTENGYEFHG